MEGRKLRLSDLPEHILLHILSMLPAKEVVRSSVICKQWRYYWKSVPLSLRFYLCGGTRKQIAEFVSSTSRELYYWRSSQNIRAIKVYLSPNYEKGYVKDVDLWVHFATQVANAECFSLEVASNSENCYEFPHFAYENTSIRNFVLSYCKLNPSGRVNWSSLVSFSVLYLKLTDGVIEKVLSGCPNLESLKMDCCMGINRLEISSVKLKEFSMITYFKLENVVSLEIYAPNLQNMHLSGYFQEIHLKNVTSLVTAVLYLDFFFEVKEAEELIKLKEFLNSVAHVENLELGPWCIECLSILELQGWQFPPSSRKFLKLNTALEELDLPGICSFLQSSSDLETLVIDWDKHVPRRRLSRYTTEDEQNMRLEAHNCDCSLLHLKNIKIINFLGPLSKNSLSKNKSLKPLAKYLLKNAVVLEKFIIVARLNGIVLSRDYARMEKKFLSFPRSSPQASLVFSSR